LGIPYLINAYTSDGQHKESQQQQQQRGEQPECQPATTPSTYSWASAGYASTNPSDYAIDMVNMQAAQPQAQPPPSRDRLRDF
jgi:hypothetical protein